MILFGVTGCMYVLCVCCMLYVERVRRPSAGSSQLPLHLQRYRDEMGLSPRAGCAAAAGDFESLSMNVGLY